MERFSCGKWNVGPFSEVDVLKCGVGGTLGILSCTGSESEAFFPA